MRFRKAIRAKRRSGGACPDVNGGGTGSAERSRLERTVQQHRRGRKGKVPVMTDKDAAIKIPKHGRIEGRMSSISVPTILPHGLFRLDVRFFRELMKKKTDVQYSFIGSTGGNGPLRLKTGKIAARPAALYGDLWAGPWCCPQS